MRALFAAALLVVSSPALSEETFQERMDRRVAEAKESMKDFGERVDSRATQYDATPSWRVEQSYRNLRRLEDDLAVRQLKRDFGYTN